MPFILQKQQRRIVPWLMEVYHSCISHSHVSHSQKREPSRDNYRKHLTMYSALVPKPSNRLTRLGKGGLTMVPMLRTNLIQSVLESSHQTTAVNRTTPHGSQFSLALWLIMIDEILQILNKKGVKVVAHSDVLVILVSRMFPSVISAIMGRCTCGLLNTDST